MKKISLTKRSEDAIRKEVLNGALIDEVAFLVSKQTKDGILDRKSVVISTRNRLDDGLVYVISGNVISRLRYVANVLGTIEVEFTHKEAVLLSLGYLMNHADDAARSAAMSHIQM